MFILNFSLILYSLLYYALFLFLGFGLTILFCPKELRKYTVFLSPIIGYCFLTLAGWYFYSLNFKGTDDYYYWILLISLLFLIAAIFKIWKHRILRDLFDRSLIIPIVIAIVVFFIVALPALRQEYLIVTVSGNNDVIFYTEASKILKEISKIDAPLIVDPHIIREGILGASLNTAFFCSVARLDPYQVQMISLYIFFIISLFLTYILAREVFKYASFAANIIILLYGLSSLLYFVIFNGFECQIIAVPLMLLIMLSNVAMIRTNKFKDAIRYAPFLILSIWGISLTYSHMLVIIYGLIISYLLLSYWKNKDVTKLLNWVVINCIALVVLVCLSPQRPQMIITMTSTMSSVTAGWFIPWITPQKLYGITPFSLPDPTADSLLHYNQLANFQNYIGITVVISVILLAVIVFGFIKLYRSDMENFLFSLSTFLLIFIGAIALSFMNISRTNEGFGGYNQFKLISFFFPLLLLSSFPLLKDTTINMGSIFQTPIKSNHHYIGIRKNTLYLLVIAALVMSNSISAGATLYAALRPGKVIAIPPDAINLQSVRNNEEIKSINIPADPGSYWNIMWEAYFLFPKKLYFEESTYYAATPLKGEWSLIRNTGKGADGILSILHKSDSNTLQINSTYSLSKSSPVFTLKFGEGWASYEPDKRWTASDVASVIVDSNEENIRTNLILRYVPLNNANSLSVYLNGIKIMDCDNNNFCAIKDLLLKKGENTIEFKAKLAAELPGNGDPRKLCYGFYTIQFEEVK